MNTKIIPIISISLLASSLFISCEDNTYKEYRGNAPVYMTYDDLRAAVSTEANVQLGNPGKIYFKDSYIFIVEELKGIHVYDNTNPALPVKKTFVKVPGVVDISVSGSTLYADSYVDLVVLDVQDINNIHETGRVENVLPYTVPATGNDYPMAGIDNRKGVVTGWELKTIREKVVSQPNNYPIFWERGKYFLDAVNAGGASSGLSGSGVGIGGSMARFGIRNEVLYILDQNSLKIFSIANKNVPAKYNELYPGWNMETMFLTDKYMFLGTTTGMVIMDITVPLSPQNKSFYNHMRSCDPVIVDDTLAYITLRSGTSCGGALNTLDVVNVKNISSPTLVATYPMTNPHGLGKDGNVLFVCDGSAGLKVYDASDSRSISNHLLFSYPGINAYDVVPIGSVLVMIGDDGLYQYDYSNLSNIHLLSSITIIKED
ncbi:MAG: hypothetical protein U0X39_09065 [Bacteroidales bacterium]